MCFIFTYDWYDGAMKSDITIIFEDDYILAVNKPARVASVPAEGIEERRTMMHIVQEFCRARGDTDKPYLLHRLDMQTSGVLLFGKHEKDRKPLEDILIQKDTHKKYLALVKGIPRGKVITAKLKARESDEKIFAQTAYNVIRVYKLPMLRTVVSLIESEIKTGRKHQIRQHFSEIGCPVVLDPLYGDFSFNKKIRTTYRLGRQFLHSSSLTFTHPMTGERMHIEAPLPMDLKIALEKMADQKTGAPLLPKRKIDPRKANFRRKRR